MPTHGEYQPGHGYFDATRNGWIKDPSRLPDTIPGKQPGLSEAAEVASWGTTRFKENPELESLIRLRDSARPEDRANYERIVAGGKRMTIADYETRKAQA